MLSGPRAAARGRGEALWHMMLVRASVLPGQAAADGESNGAPLSWTTLPHPAAKPLCYTRPVQRSRANSNSRRNASLMLLLFTLLLAAL